MTPALIALLVLDLLLMTSLWMQAKGHLARSRKNADEWRDIAAQWERAFKGMQTANQSLERTIDQYKTMIGSGTQPASAERAVDRAGAQRPDPPPSSSIDTSTRVLHADTLDHLADTEAHPAVKAALIDGAKALRERRRWEFLEGDQEPQG